MKKANIKTLLKSSWRLFFFLVLIELFSILVYIFLISLVKMNDNFNKFDQNLFITKRKGQKYQKI